MTACERGNWIDTEGHIETRPPPLKRGVQYEIVITSMEKEPLEDYCAGATKDSVPCRVFPERMRPPPYEYYKYYARITGAPNVAKEIMLTKNCIRTRKKHQQIQKFIQAWQIPRRTARGIQTQKTVKQILGIP